MAPGAEEKEAQTAPPAAAVFWQKVRSVRNLFGGKTDRPLPSNNNIPTHTHTHRVSLALLLLRCRRSASATGGRLASANNRREAPHRDVVIDAVQQRVTVQL